MVHEVRVLDHEQRLKLLSHSLIIGELNLIDYLFIYQVSIQAVGVQFVLLIAPKTHTG